MMATDNLSVVGEAAKSEPTLYDLASDIQVQASRIHSLAEAIDEVAELPSDIDTQTRLLDYVNLLRESALKAKASGEKVEVHALRAMKAADQ
jgi:hypothetical protein